MVLSSFGHIIDLSQNKMKNQPVGWYVCVPSGNKPF